MSTHTIETAPGTGTLVGTWTVSSVINGEPAPFSSTLTFNADHTLDVGGPKGPDGTPSFTGQGHWINRPDGTFTYYLTHPIPDGRGGTMGEIHSIQEVTVDGDGHSSTGSAVFHKTDGSIMPPTPVTLIGAR
ncbi:hypothetical protein [Streptomyces sp. CB03238]|uniref:hypothetical protein n=1 Tax=Streptomyces sp. CB03238 TaxID=1907777 RepID=UPI000A10295B|nr:hypothetical protein [Streptomyces sp. CB03238]ORT56550.1 hypothetical protein BKD26_27435 [Streptomyces sp. CB03238]